MARPRVNRWMVVAVLAIGAILGASLLVGIQTSQAKRWVFGSGFTVQEVEVSRDGDFFVTTSQPPEGQPSATVIHFFRADAVSWNATIAGKVTELALASSGALVAAGLEGGGVRLFTGRGADLGSWPTQGPVRSLATTEDGGLVAVAAPLERNLAERGGVLLYRLGKPLPILQVPLADAASVALSEDGSVLAAASSGSHTTQLRVYDRSVSESTPHIINDFPGRFAALDVANDGRHILLVTEQAAFLLSRLHDRPVGIVPASPTPDVRYAGGDLAPDGQSYLLLDHDRTGIDLHKWGEASPRWTARDHDGYTSFGIDNAGARVVVVDTTGRLAVLSVTTGQPIKELTLASDARTVALSPNGEYVLAGDDNGRLYRAQSGYGGLLGALPDPIVSTLYAAPGFLLWSGVLAALMVVSAPVAAPLVRRLGPKLRPPREPPATPTAPGTDHTWDVKPLDGPVRADDLVVEKNGRRILHVAHLHAEPGTVTAIIGGSGEGKSTLLYALLGHGVTHGTIRLGTIDPRRAVRATRDLAGFVPQDLQLYESLTPRENLTAFGGQFRADDPHLAEEAARLLRLVGLDPTTERPVSSLSGGERRRVSIAATLLHAPGLLVLDEPTTGLDPLTRRHLWRMLADLTDRLGVTVLVSTHYLEEAEGADNVVLLEDGAVLACGTPNAIIASAPGGGRHWTARITHPSGHTGARLHDALVDLLACGDDAPVRDLHVTEDHVHMRLQAPETLADVLRTLNLAGHQIESSDFTPMTFEQAFVAHLGEARRAAGRSGAPCGHDGPHSTT